MQKITIWIRDDTDGATPITVNMRRDGEYLVLENELIRIQILTDLLLATLGEEGHG